MMRMKSLKTSVNKYLIIFRNIIEESYHNLILYHHDP